MTRYLVAATLAALAALAAGVVWVLAHAPVEDAPPRRRSPDHPVYHTTKEPRP